MHLRVKIKFLGAILVQPVRRQNFAGTGAPYILQHLRLCRKHVVHCTFHICSPDKLLVNMVNAVNMVNMFRKHGIGGKRGKHGKHVLVFTSAL